ncbi:hypothetical protein [Anaeromyxobacter sp. PSR-1]|uniref:hypothetical protein n=1 Tax=Anaeromyxobacter sp. PSR-1 TaxID=1300915 RepID=UPI0007515F71|nr:hypothetical protein [Anaeromyxobacter sp. PSR-1]
MADLPRLAEIVEARKSVERLQSFDASTLTRAGELGSLNFQDVVAPAQRLINLVSLISLDAIDDLPIAHANAVRSQADSIFSYFDQILKFTLEVGSPKQARDQFVAQVRTAYDHAWTALNPVIAYSLRRSSDFDRLEREARATIQSMKDRVAELEAEMAKRKADADETLKEIRKVAGEHGVSQQAIYFKDEAEAHDKLATTWLNRTVGLTIVLLGYAVSTFFIHKIPWLAPQGVYETAQLAVSKALVFVTIAFLLVLAARNYTAHRHNAVVNKHRQNGLVTYGALVKAASAGANSDIILTKAAECIFDSQSTGFAKGDGVDSGGMSMINVGVPALKMTGPTS